MCSMAMEANPPESRRSTATKNIVWNCVSRCPQVLGCRRLAKDAPELNLTWIGSLQKLKNGNYVVSNFLRGQEGKGAHAFEVTRDKRVVWTFADHKLAKSITTIRILDDK